MPESRDEPTLVPAQPSRDAPWYADPAQREAVVSTLKALASPLTDAYHHAANLWQGKGDYGMELAGGLLAAGGLAVPEARGMTAAEEVAAPYVMKAAKAAKDYITPEGLPIKGPAFDKAARQAKAIVARGGLEPVTPRDVSWLPPVEQQAIPRYVPARGISERMARAMDNPQVTGGVSDYIDQGVGMGAHNYYPSAQHVRGAFWNELGPEEGQRGFSDYGGQNAATSPRSDVPTNIRNSSFYYVQGRQGVPLEQHIVPDEEAEGGFRVQLPYPYGHIAQKLHWGNLKNIFDPDAGDLSAAVTRMRGWNIFNNPKPVSYDYNVQGNYIPVAGDTHAVRLPAMLSEDPDWLLPSFQQSLSTKNPGAMSLAKQYGEIGVNSKGKPIVTYRPRDLYDTKRLSMETAQSIPSFWETMPNENEYGALEQLYTDISGKKGLQPAWGQSSAWSGGGKKTGLETPANKTYDDMFNDRVLYTALVRGEDPKETLRMFIRGQKPLIGLGGAAATGAAATGAGGGHGNNVNDTIQALGAGGT